MCRRSLASLPSLCAAWSAVSLGSASMADSAVEVVLSSSSRLDYQPAGACAPHCAEATDHPGARGTDVKYLPLHFGGAGYAHTNITDAFVSLSIGIGYSSVTWYGTYSDNLGQGVSSVDDGPTTTIDLYRAGAAYNQSLWRATLDPSRPHTVTIRAAPAASPRLWLDLDALVLQRVAVAPASSSASASALLMLSTSTASTTTASSVAPPLSLITLSSSLFSRPTIPAPPPPSQPRAIDSPDNLALAVSMGVLTFILAATAALWIWHRRRRHTQLSLPDYSAKSFTRPSGTDSWLDSTETSERAKARTSIRSADTSVAFSAPRRFSRFGAARSSVTTEAIATDRPSAAHTSELFGTRTFGSEHSCA